MKLSTLLMIGIIAIVACYAAIMGATISNSYDARIALERLKFDIRTSLPLFPGKQP